MFCKVCCFCYGILSVTLCLNTVINKQALYDSLTRCGSLVVECSPLKRTTQVRVLGSTYYNIVKRGIIKTSVLNGKF